MQQYACQVSSIQMTLERLNESFKADDSVSVDCPRASLIHRYQQGDMVRLGKIPGCLRGDIIDQMCVCR